MLAAVLFFVRKKRRIGAVPLPAPHENRAVVRRICKRKCRCWSSFAVFLCDYAASVVCPHHNLVFLRNGKGGAVLPPDLRRAGLYACFPVDIVACVSAERRVDGNSRSASMRLCHCGHRKAQKSFYSSVIATPLQCSKKQAPPEGLFCCTHQNKTFFYKLSRYASGDTPKAALNCRQKRG